MKRTGKKGRAAAWRRLRNLLLVFIAYAVLFLTMTSSLFDLRSVEILGNHQITRTEILHLSGVNLRNNIFSLSLRD
ncbi:MAG: FtsQ-type POTRA domain-containing protein, partial [bacterium]|nr:FtsQ-type POTRA domain-containing protein [bacterium]